KALLTLPAWELDRPLPERVERIVAAWLADESVARFLQVNVHRDVRWFNKEAFEQLASWAAAIESIRDIGDRGLDARQSRVAAGGEISATVEALIATAEHSGYRF